MKIEYYGWLDQMTGQTAWPPESESDADLETRRRRIMAVRRALRRLPKLERQLILAHHFYGDSLSYAARRESLSFAVAVSGYRRGLRRLRSQLSAFVAEEFDVAAEASTCVICASPHRTDIERILRSRTRHEGFARVIAEIWDKCGLRLRSPQTIVGHVKYHSTKRGER